MILCSFIGEIIAIPDIDMCTFWIIMFLYAMNYDDLGDLTAVTKRKIIGELL